MWGELKMLENFLLANGMFSRVTGVFLGRGLAITIKGTDCLILEKDDATDDYYNLYQGDHAGAIGYLSQWWDL